jgi:hypothetical protein
VAYPKTVGGGEIALHLGGIALSKHGLDARGEVGWDAAHIVAAITVPTVVPAAAAATAIPASPVLGCATVAATIATAIARVSAAAALRWRWRWQTRLTVCGPVHVR